MHRMSENLEDMTLPWAYRSTLEAKRRTREMAFRDKRSYVGIRPDGREFLKLFGRDMELQWDRVFERDKGICQLCGDHCGIMGEADHIRSRGRGGDDSLENLRLVCGASTKNKCHLHRHVRVKFGTADLAKVEQQDPIRLAIRK